MFYSQTQTSKFQNYTKSEKNKDENAQDPYLELAKKFVAILEGREKSDDAPVLYSIIGYMLYKNIQSGGQNSSKTFIQGLFRRTSDNETETFYNNELSEWDTKRSSEHIKQIYEKYCFLTHMTTKSLKEDSATLQDYGYEIAETQDESKVFTKIKNKKDAKPYSELTDDQKSSAESLELFISTQFEITGIVNDQIDVKDVRERYKSFCGTDVTEQEFISEDVAAKYNIAVQIEKKYDIRRKNDDNQSSAPNLPSGGGFLSDLGLGLPYISLDKKESNQPPVFVFNEYDDFFSFIFDPIKALNEKSLDSSAAYSPLRIYIQSIIFNISLLKTRFSHYEYRRDEDRNVLSYYFQIIYVPLWQVYDAILVLGSQLFSTVFVLPIIFVLIVMQTSYSIYSLYEPRDLLFKEDVYYRPWYIWRNYENTEPHIIAVTIIVVYYSLVAYLIQIIKYSRSYFPEDIGFLMETKTYQKGLGKQLNNLQWALFVFIFFLASFYIGVVFVWLILGAIINPNNFLVYASSAATFAATLNAQIAYVQSLYEKGYQMVKDIVFKIYIGTVNQIAGSLIKETQKVLDPSNQIINSSIFQEAQKTAEQLGFGEQLKEISSSSQNMLDSISTLNLDSGQNAFKVLKDKFIEKAISSFKRVAVNQYKLPEQVAEAIVQLNFNGFDEVVEQLAINIQYESHHAISASMIIWLHTTLKSLYQHFSNKSKKLTFGGEDKELQELIPQIQDQFLNSILETIFLRCDDIDNAPQLQQVIKELFSFMVFLQSGQAEKDALIKQFGNILEQVQNIAKFDNQLFQGVKAILEFLSLIITQPSNLDEAKKKLIISILENYGFNQEIGLLIQLLFSQQYQIQYKFGKLVVEEEKEITQRIISFQQKNFKHDDPILETKAELLITNAIDINRLKFGVNNVDSIVQFVFSQLENNGYAPLVQILQPIFNDNKVWVTHIIGAIMLLSGRSWSSFFLNFITVQGQNRLLTLELVNIGSQILWNVKGIEQKKDDQDLVHVDNEEEAEQPEDQDENNYSQEDYYEEDQENQQSELDINWIQRIWTQKYQSFPTREQKLLGKNIIKLISKGIGLTEEQLIGLILILKSEMGNTVYHQAFYEFMLLKLMNEPGENLEKQKDSLRTLMEMFACKDFEQVFGQLLQLEFGSKDKREEIVSSFLQMINSKLAYDIFGGKQLKIAVDTLEIESLISQFSTQEQQILNGLIQEDKAETVNFFKSEKITFYTFLKKTYPGDDVPKSLKEEFIQQIYLKSPFFKMQFIYLFLQIQSVIAGSGGSAVSVSLISLDSQCPLRAEAFQNLLKILAFKDGTEMSQGIQYFIKKNTDVQLGNWFKNVDLQLVIDQIDKMIKLEQFVSSIVNVPYSLPFYLQHLERLFCNNILDTQFPIKNSSFNIWVKYGLEFLENKGVIDTPTHEFIRSFAMIIFEKNPDFITDYTKKIFLKYNDYFGKKYDTQNLTIQQLILGIFENDQEILREFLYKHAQQCLKNQDEIMFYQKLLAFNQGLTELETKEGQTTQDAQALVHGKNPHADIDIKNLQWLGRRIKYSLGFDQESFTSFSSSYIKKVFQVSEPEIEMLTSFLGMFTEKPDYEQLNTNFKLEPDLVKMAIFTTQAITQVDKLKLIKTWINSSSSRETISEAFYVDDFEALYFLIRILAYNVQLDDISEVQTRLKMGVTQEQKQVYKYLLAYRFDFDHGLTFESSRSQQRKLKELRIESVTKDAYLKGKGNMQELLHWFCEPKPILFLHKTLNDENLRTALNAPELTKNSALNQYIPTLLLAAIVSIAKNDRENKYLAFSPQEVQLSSKKIEEQRSSRLEQQMHFLQQELDEANLTSSLLMLQLTFGINPLLSMGIVSADGQRSMDVFRKGLSAESRKALKVCLEQLDDYNKFKMINRYLGACVDTAYHIIQFSDKKDRLKVSNEYIRNGYQKVAEIFGLGMKVFEGLLLDISKSSIGPTTHNFQKGCPLATLIVLFSLKHLRQIFQKTLYPKPENKEKVYEKPCQNYLKANQLIDLILVPFQNFLYVENYESFQVVDKDFFGNFICQGLFSSKHLYQKIISNIDFIKLQTFLYPNIGDPLVNYKRDTNELKTLNYDSFGGQFCNFKDTIEQAKEVAGLDAQRFKSSQSLNFVYNGYLDSGIFPYLDQSDVQNRWSLFDQTVQSIVCEESSIKKNLLIPLQDKIQYEEHLMLYYSSDYYPTHNKLLKEKNPFLAFINSKVSMTTSIKLDGKDETQKKLMDGYIKRISAWQKVLQDQIEFKYQKCTLITKYSEKTLQALKKIILTDKQLEQSQADLRVAKQDSQAFSFIKYQQGQCENKILKADNVDEQVNEEQDDSMQGQQSKKTSSTMNFTNYVKSITNLSMYPKPTDGYNVLLHILFCSQKVSKYEDQFYYKFQSQLDTFQTLLLILIRLELEKSKSEGNFDYLNERIPRQYKYYTLGDGLDNDASEPDYTLKENSKKIGDNLEKIIGNCSQIGEQKRPYIKILIRAYLGDVESWYALIEQYRKVFIPPSIKPKKKTISDVLLNKVIYRLLIETKRLNLRSAKLSKNSQTTRTFYEIANSFSNFDQKDFIVSNIRSCLASTPEIKNPNLIFLETVGNYLNFTFKKNFQSLDKEFINTLIEIAFKPVDLKKITPSDKNYMQVFMEFYFFLIFQKNSKIDPKQFETLEKNVQEAKLFDDKTWVLMKTFLDVQRSNDLEILLMKILNIITVNQDKLGEYLPDVQNLISINSWFYIRQIQFDWNRYYVNSPKHVGYDDDDNPIYSELKPGAKTPQIIKEQTIKILLYPIMRLLGKVNFINMGDIVLEKQASLKEFFDSAKDFQQTLNIEHYNDMLSGIQYAQDFEVNGYQQIPLMTDYANLVVWSGAIDEFDSKNQKFHIKDMIQILSSFLSKQTLNKEVQAIIKLLSIQFMQQGIGLVDELIQTEYIWDLQGQEQDEAEQYDPQKIVSEAFLQTVQKNLDKGQSQILQQLPQKEIYQQIVINLQNISKIEEFKGPQFKQIITSLFKNKEQLRKFLEQLIDIIMSDQQLEIEQLKDLPKSLMDISLTEDIKNHPSFQKLQIEKYAQLIKDFIALMKYFREVSGKQFSETECLNLIKPILTNLYKQKGDNKEPNAIEYNIDTLIKVFEGLIALKDKKFDQIQPEFFTVFGMSQANAKSIIKICSDFQKALKSPQDLISEKIKSFGNPEILKCGQYLSAVSQKLEDSKDLGIEDLFKLVDKNGSKTIDSEEFMVFLKRTGIEISQHKLKEIFVSIKGEEIQDISTATLNINEFQKALNYIQSQTLTLSMEKLGISKKTLYTSLIIVMVYLLIVIAFIIIGIQAFAIPGTFGSIVNSAMPAMGGTGLSKSSTKDKDNLFDLQKLQSIVERSVKIIQSVKI